MTTSWKDSLKTSAKEALASIARDTLKPARQAIHDLEKLGRTVRLNEAQDGLLVSQDSSGKPIPDELAERIKQHKAELLELLKSGGADVWVWKPEDLLIRVSLAQSSVTDFILAPPVDGLPQTAIKPEIQKALLEGAKPEWRAVIRKKGGIVAYPASAAEALKTALAKKPEKEEAA